MSSSAPDFVQSRPEAGHAHLADDTAHQTCTGMSPCAGLANSAKLVRTSDALLLCLVSQGLLSNSMKNCNIIRPARPLAERTPNSLQPPPRTQGNRGGADVPRLGY